MGGGKPAMAEPAEEAAEGELQPQGNPFEQYSQPLGDLKRRYTTQYAQARREQVKRILKWRRFWEGDQNIAWNESHGEWFSASRPTARIQNNEEVQEAFVLNKVRPYGLSFISLVRGNRPTVKWRPSSKARRVDVLAAESADDFMRYYERVSRVKDELEQEARYFWTDGIYGSYVRYVEDGDRFGWTIEDVTSEQPVDMCPRCGTAAPAAQPEPGMPPMPPGMGGGGGMPPMPGVGAPPGMPPMGGAPCPTCGGPTTPTTREVKTGQKRVPKGRVVRDVVGGLELFLPLLARRQDEMPFLARDYEVDKCHVMQRWPYLEIELGKDEGGSGGAEETWDRRARLSMLGGATVQKVTRRGLIEGADYITISTWWFRPWAFNAVEDEEEREALKQAFPDGCRATFAGGLLAEVVAEKMDDVWRICKAMPGDGYNTAAISTDSIPMQELYNDLFNLMRDNVEYNLPMLFVDPDAYDVTQIADTRVRGGAMYAAKAGPGSSLAQRIHQTQPGQLPAYAMQLMTGIGGDEMQHATGVQPAAYGGNTGGNTTAHGIAIERDQAMGRIGMHHSQIDEHWTEWTPLAVAAYVRSGKPVSLSVKYGPDRQIDPEILKAGEYEVDREVSSEYPMTWAQRRGALMEVLAMPAGAGLFGILANASKLKSAAGLDVELPGESGYRMQLDEIDELLRAGPRQEPIPDPQKPGQPLMDPKTGQPMMQVVGSSIPVQPGLEDDMAHIQCMRDWWASGDAKQAKRDNPQGIQNFLMHFQEHMNSSQAQMAQQQAAGAPGGGQPPPQQQKPGAGAPRQGE